MTDEISAQVEQQPAKRKRGRQPGSPNPKSHYSPPPDMKPAQLRAWVISNTKVLENLLRMADGKRVQLTGPSGKKYWADTDVATMRWAMDRVLKRVLPELSGITLSGEADGAPIVLANRPADPELVRRLALMFLEADRGGRWTEWRGGGAAKRPENRSS